MATVLEIFTNPKDLRILIAQIEDDGPYCVEFSRGPGHNFKPLLSSQPFTSEFEMAVETVRETLEGIRQVAAKEFEGGGIFFQILNPERQTIDESRILNPDLIAQIVENLRQYHVANTYSM